MQTSNNYVFLKFGEQNQVTTTATATTEGCEFRVLFYFVIFQAI